MKKKTEARRQAIIDVAAEVFREMGFERALMSEICRRIGGSKATIYNYFPSKELLFVEVMRQATDAEFKGILKLLNHTVEDVAEALQHFGEGLLSLIYSPEVLAARRLAISSVGDGEFGRACFEQGPKRSMSEVSAFLLALMEKGKLRQCDPAVASLHLRGLLESELLDSLVFRIESDMGPERIKEIVARAVAVFMAGYGPHDAGTNPSSDCPKG
ncbi:TetR/AcrR family transcriptional regulator [Niveibacterium terrae]|uniref:TetR/AcrR family transcriptional regulator n=1 Tax=Niveibacterium terrae TaxID=3373598 RepID=UPI003A92B844